MMRKLANAWLRAVYAVLIGLVLALGYLAVIEEPIAAMISAAIVLVLAVTLWAVRTAGGSSDDPTTPTKAD